MGDSSWSPPAWFAAVNPVLAANAFLGNKVLTKGIQEVDKATGAKDARDKAQATADSQAAQAKNLSDAATARAADAESQATAISTRNAARSRQAAMIAAAGGRSSTILTSPLGVPASATPPKIVLGG